MIGVAPNGARKTKDDHPQLPITPRELAKTAAECKEAGACMIHLHVRDEQQRHSLDADRYKVAIKAIRQEVGSDLIIQITTEAVGIYQASQQMQTVKLVKPEAVSLAIRELCAEEADETSAAEFFHWLQKEHISPQYILYTADDIRRFNDMQTRGIVPHEKASVLLVLGRYTTNQQSNADDLSALLGAMNPINSWWLCAFGATELQCMRSAMESGGHCRVGFENNLFLSDGSIAADNAAVVTGLTDCADKYNRSPVSADAARELLEIWQ